MSLRGCKLSVGNHLSQYESLHPFFSDHAEADFVGSALVRESLNSSTGDDDKIYFFFTERSQEQKTTYSHSRVARVARVCKVRAELKEMREDIRQPGAKLRIITLTQAKSWLMIGEGAIMDESLDRDFIGNKAPGADCEADEWFAASVCLRVRGMADCRGKDRMFSILCCLKCE